MYRHIPILLLCTAALAAEDPPVVARGRSAYISACGFCHGNDATGNRAPDLIRSTLVNHDDNGNLVLTLVLLNPAQVEYSF